MVIKVARTTDEARNTLKRLEQLLQHIRGSWVFVEGKRDREALVRLGCTNILTVSGNLRSSCLAVKGRAETVVVLTDLDRRGEELAKAAVDELERYSIMAELRTRKELAGILGLRHFEDAERKYSELMERMKELRVI